MSLLPGRASTLLNLGIARYRLGRYDDATAPLEEALAQEPGDASAWLHLGMCRVELHRSEGAMHALDRALAINPDLGVACSLRGDLLKNQGRLEEAAAAYQRALDLGFEPDLHRYYLAGLRRGDAPPSPPAGYVRHLFDGYSADFDQHLVQVLGYRGPQLLAEGLGGAHFRAALDMGCGTGLAAPLLRPMADRLHGIDLSPNMTRLARARGLYDEVADGDLAGWLAATDQRYDLLFAADVFIYVGALEAVFAGAARVLQPGGTFCLSVEAADEQDVELRPSLRYAHSERYIRKLAGLHGFDFSRCTRHPLRIDQGQPLQGLFAWLTRPAVSA